MSSQHWDTLTLLLMHTVGADSRSLRMPLYVLLTCSVCLLTFFLLLSASSLLELYTHRVSHSPLPRGSAGGSLAHPTSGWCGPIGRGDPHEAFCEFVAKLQSGRCRAWCYVHWRLDDGFLVSDEPLDDECSSVLGLLPGSQDPSRPTSENADQTLVQRNLDGPNGPELPDLSLGPNRWPPVPPRRHSSNGLVPPPSGSVPVRGKATSLACLTSAHLETTSST